MRKLIILMMIVAAALAGQPGFRVMSTWTARSMCKTSTSWSTSCWAPTRPATMRAGPTSMAAARSMWETSTPSSTSCWAPTDSH